MNAAPETGRLRIVKKPVHGTPQFYLVTGKEKANGRYLSKKEHLALITSYLQRDYDRQIIQTADQLTAAIDTFLAAVPEQTLSQLYENEPSTRILPFLIQMAGVN